jgi:hypothetical protein
MKGVVCALLFGPAALAAPRMAVVAVGTCADPDLQRDTRLLTDLVRDRVGPQALTEEEFRRRVGSPPGATLDELRRTLARAEALFYAGRPQEALTLLEQLSVDLARLPPGTDRWATYASTELLRGVALSALKRRDASDDAFRQVLRLQPGYRMSAASYSPSLRARFEKLRQEQAHAPTVKLTVTSTPPGATVFLDGLPVARTPLVRELSPGLYQLLAGQDGGLSLPHTLALRDDLAFNVDLVFERSLPASRDLCLAAPADAPGTLPVANALKLGLLLELEQLVMVRLDRDHPASPVLIATVLDVPTALRTREGWLRVSNPAVVPDGLAELATFAVTGEASDRVGIEGQPPPLAAAASTGPPPSVTQTVETGRTWRTPTGIGVAAAGVVGVSLGVVFLVQGNQAANEFNARYQNGTAPPPTEASSTQSLGSQATSNQNLGVVLISVGAAAVAGGLALWLTDAPGKQGTHAALVVTPGSVVLAGQLP